MGYRALGRTGLLVSAIGWRNLFRAYYVDDEMIAVADCVMSPVRAVRENRLPEYGPEQARLEREVTLATYDSARWEGEPVKLLPTR